MSDPERKRLEEDRLARRDWRKWGPYLSERQWGTVREDYSAGGTAWEFFPHDHARARAYRWGEDGIGGISDTKQHMCLSLAMWNEKDAILKERLFGLTNTEGNHGEDVKELYYYLDATPTASYLRMLYKYPQRAFPYDQIVHENASRSKADAEFELLDTGVFEDDRYFDVFIEYAKAGADDVLMRITVCNRGPDAAPIHLLPTLWFRNTWSWDEDTTKPVMHLDDGVVAAEHNTLGSMFLHVERGDDVLFTENETNHHRLFGYGSTDGHYKDAFHRMLTEGDASAVNPRLSGTKAAAHMRLSIPAGGQRVVRVRLSASRHAAPWSDFDAVFDDRIKESDSFYAPLTAKMDDDETRIYRQAHAGLIWTRQYFGYDVARWLDGDPTQPAPPPGRDRGRNSDWEHLNNADIISMPDTWEYPWYAAWDLAFHCLPIARVDPEFAKEQLVLLTREWYMHPNGQIPAYEWAFGDVNPPVHAWAAWRVFQIDRQQRGTGDLPFLERVFHKMLLNFTWWVNRKDAEGRNVFQGGFLGLDNIGVFDRSAPLPTGGHIDQADGTAWMAMYSLNMMRIAMELSLHNPVYEDIATKFFEHFLYIARALTSIGSEHIGLWDEEDEFFYDLLHLPDGSMHRLKIRSMVGLIPLFAVETLEPELLECLPNFTARLEWFLANRPDLAELVSHWQVPGVGQKRLLSLLRGHRMKCLLRRMLDETRFLSDYGVRSMSRDHLDEPYRLNINGGEHVVKYEPAESRTELFGGNSNWRGPIWFPVNYLIIESLQRFHDYYSDDFRIECPTGSGNMMSIREVAAELGTRLTRLFKRDQKGERAVFGPRQKQQHDPHFKDHLLFYEFFDGDSGRGAGASHQTGWTALVAMLLEKEEQHKKPPVPR